MRGQFGALFSYFKRWAQRHDAGTRVVNSARAKVELQVQAIEMLLYSR